MKKAEAMREATRLVLDAKKIGVKMIKDVDYANKLFKTLTTEEHSHNIIGRNIRQRLYHLLHSYTHDQRGQLLLSE